jgi:hypothetical protein
MAITVSGSGFTAASRVGCPSLVPTTFVDANTLTAVIPDLGGPQGGSTTVAVFVFNDDGSLSNSQLITIEFPRTQAQAWTTIARVIGEVPGFIRGGNIADSTITGWIESCSQEVTGCLLKRGLPLDPSQWQQPDGLTASPDASAVLEMVSRMGAAARLAAAIYSQSGAGVSALATDCQKSYQRGLQALRDGDYDKLFQPSSVTDITGPSFGSNLSTCGESRPAFRKDKVF